MITRAVNRVLLVALLFTAGLLLMSGYYLKVQIGRVGELSEQLDQAVEHNRQWQALLDEIGRHSLLLEALDRRLSESDKQSRERLGQFERGLRDAISELQEVSDWAAAHVPEPVVGLMCEQRHLAPAIRARHCAGAVSD